MNVIRAVYGGSIGNAGRAKVKRARRGFEKNWNVFGDPLEDIWIGHFHHNTLWRKFKALKNELSYKFKEEMI